MVSLSLYSLYLVFVCKAQNCFLFICFKKFRGSREGAQLAKCLPCKHKDLDHDPQHPHKKPRTFQRVFVTAVLGGRGLRTHQLV